MLHFKKINKEKYLEILLFYTCVPKIFLSYYSPKNLKNKNFEKLKKKCLQILSLYKCVP